MTTLDEAVALARGESGLTVVSTLRADNTIQASLVNAGVLAHPESGSPVLAFVTYGRSPGVRVTVPGDRQEATAALVDLAPAVSPLPTTKRCN